MEFQVRYKPSPYIFNSEANWKSTAGRWALVSHSRSKNKQSSIESISLITGGACPINTDGENPIDLSAFRSLRDISWTGLQLSQEFDALSRALKNSSKHHELPDLGFIRLDMLEQSNPQEFQLLG
jgi:hypothetical protein